MSPIITVSPAGQIVGRALGNGPNTTFDNEANWSGFQLARVDNPIPVAPSTWSSIKSLY